MTPAVRALLIVNVAVFFLQMTLGGITSAFAFRPQYVLVQPWTLVTYMFLHSGPMHILLNMLGLFFFGPRVEERIGTRRFTILWFLSGVSGALLSMLLSPAGLVGASAGTFGVMMAFAHYWPHEPIHIWGIIPVPARLLVIITTIATLYSGFRPGGSNIAHFAHLGGYVGAFLYLKWLDRRRTAFRQKATVIPAAPDRQLARWKSVDTSSVHAVNREEVDRILDKISAQGLASLTPQERTFLSHFVPPDDRVSRND